MKPLFAIGLLLIVAKAFLCAGIPEPESCKSKAIDAKALQEILRPVDRARVTYKDAGCKSVVDVADKEWLSSFTSFLCKVDYEPAICCFCLLESNTVTLYADDKELLSIYWSAPDRIIIHGVIEGGYYSVDPRVYAHFTALCERKKEQQDPWEFIGAPKVPKRIEIELPFTKKPNQISEVSKQGKN